MELRNNCVDSELAKNNKRKIERGSDSENYYGMWSEKFKVSHNFSCENFGPSAKFSSFSVATDKYFQKILFHRIPRMNSSGKLNPYKKSSLNPHAHSVIN